MAFGKSKYSKKNYAVHPCKVFLYVDYNNKTIKGWDSEKKEKTELNLSTPFIFVGNTLGIGWWDKDNKVKLYSNEINDMKTEWLEVFEWINKEREVVASGMWSDIKDDVKRKGWMLQTNIYAITEDGNIFDLQVSWWAMFDIVWQLQKLGEKVVKISWIEEKENNGFKFKSLKIEQTGEVSKEMKETLKQTQNDFDTYFDEKKEELEISYNNKKKQDEDILPF